MPHRTLPSLCRGLTRKRLGRSALGRAVVCVALTCGAALAVPATSLGRGGAAHASASARALCKAERIGCSGHWATLGGRKVYTLDTPVVIDGHGRIRAHAAYFASSIKNDGVGLCWSSLGTHSDGAEAVDYACNGSANQTWVMSTASGGGVYFYNQGDQWCLNNFQGRFSDYNPQTMWPCNDRGGASNYKQSYVVFGPANGHSDSITTVNSSDNVSGYCLSSVGATYSGSPIDEFTCNGSGNQHWTGGTLTAP